MSSPSKADVQMFVDKLFARIGSDFSNRTLRRYQLKFSTHFVERIQERAEWDDLKIINDLLTKTISKHLCEMIYWAHLEGRPRRLEIQRGRFIIGIIFSDTFNKFICTTFVNSRKYEGSRSTFLLEPK